MNSDRQATATHEISGLPAVHATDGMASPASAALTNRASDARANDARTENARLDDARTDAGAPPSVPRIDRRPRRLSPQACAADNLLSHSIEYLTDARKLPSGKVEMLSPVEPDVQAVVLLMNARHEVYLACPVIERRTKSGLFGMFKGPDRRQSRP